MCRLFGLNAGHERVKATFWLLDAPDSLVAESHRNVDGSGIGFFDGAGRIMAHNGGFDELPLLEEQLGSYRSLVQGDTDSERFFALITQQVDAHDGDVGAGITAAAGWIAANLPLSSLNTVVAMPGELWALRYPDQHALHILERPATQDALHVRSATSVVHAPGLPAGSVVVASEELDGETGWRMLAPRRARPRHRGPGRALFDGSARSAGAPGTDHQPEPEYRHLTRSFGRAPAEPPERGEDREGGNRDSLVPSQGRGAGLAAGEVPTRWRLFTGSGESAGELVLPRHFPWYRVQTWWRGYPVRTSRGWFGPRSSSLARPTWTPREPW